MPDASHSQQPKPCNAVKGVVREGRSLKKGRFFETSIYTARKAVKRGVLKLKVPKFQQLVVYYARYGKQTATISSER